jgi:hypothetical protein
MSGIRGRLVPRDSNEYRWVASVIQSVSKLSGTTSRWNQELYEELRPHASGWAMDDGGMTVNAAQVFTPVAQAYTADRPLTEDELEQLRDAVLTVAHEARHLIHAFGDENTAGAVPAKSADALILEEGLTETWALNNLDAVIRDIGLHKVQPDVLRTESVNGYPAYTAATDELVRGTAELAELPEEQVRDTLEKTDRSQRWAAVADLVIDKRLAGLMPPQHRDHVKTQLVNAMRPQLNGLGAVQSNKDLPEETKTTAGQQSGQRVTAALGAVTADIEQHYRDWYAEQAAQPQQVEPQQAQQADVRHLRQFLQDEPTVRLGTVPASEAATGERPHVDPRRGIGMGE